LVASSNSAFRIVVPKIEELNADGVLAGAGKVPGSDNCHRPITG